MRRGRATLKRSVNTRRTPCIGICSTTYGDRVCRGCKRFAHEIDAWNRFDAEQQRAVWQRLDELRDAAVRTFVTVADPERLARRAMALRVPTSTSAATQAYEVLRRAERDLEAAGLELTELGSRATSSRVFDALDREFLMRSRAYYERSFRTPGA